MRRSLVSIAAVQLGLVACATTLAEPIESRETCSVSESDRAWLNRSISAWHLASEKITGIGPIARLDGIFFDAKCTLISTDAMTGGTREGARFTATPHNGTIQLPDGETIPATVTSFMQAADERDPYFVMALPSVWRSGGVPGGVLGLETLITAVLLHEGTHVVQFPTYGQQVTDLINSYQLPESFNDDSIQEQFEANREFSDSVSREIDLLFAAASAGSVAEAHRLVTEAIELLHSRRARWFVGDLEYLSAAENLWLTFEGSGQWVGYSWLVHPEGGKVAVSTAVDGFGRRSRFWTQNHGLALFLAADTLKAQWREATFGDGKRTIVEILDNALFTGGGRDAAAAKADSPTAFIITIDETFAAPGGVTFTLKKFGMGKMLKFQLDVMIGEEKTSFEFSPYEPPRRWHFEGYFAGFVIALNTHPDLLPGGPNLTSEERTSRRRQRQLTLTRSPAPADDKALRKSALEIASSKLRGMGCTGIGVGYSVSAGTLNAYNNASPTSAAPRCSVQVGLYTHTVFANDSRPIIGMGSLAPEAIRKVVNDNMQEIRGCYERELQQGRELQGRAVMKWIIAPTGSVVKVGVKESTLNNADVERCIMDQIKRWKFPRPVGGGVVEVNYPFILCCSN